ARRPHRAPRNPRVPQRLPGRARPRGALPRRPAGARRRHDPLLRPLLHGALARGSRAVPRPRGRRVRGDDPGPVQDPAAEDPQVRPQAGREGADPGPDHRQAEDRLLQRCRRRLVPGTDTRRRGRLPARLRAALRGAARPRRDRDARPPAGRRDGHAPRAAAARDPDARGLADELPRPRSGGRTGARARAHRRVNTYAIVTPVRNETENLRRLAESLSAQSLRPKTWMVVDTGSDDGTPDVITELMREHDWIATCTSRAGESPTRARAIVHGFNVGVIELGV